MLIAAPMDPPKLQYRPALGFQKMVAAQLKSHLEMFVMKMQY